MNYRLYIDEVGNSGLTLRNLPHPNDRYLSLTGIMFEQDYVRTSVAPQLERLKATYFGSHPDEPVILHRKEIIGKKFPFDCLKDPTTEKSFSADLLQLLQDLDYTVITATIDKLEHVERHGKWAHDPYHYCLTVIMERYVKSLRRLQATGDVMAESRGGKEDMRLKECFRDIWENGTYWTWGGLFALHFTSRELKLKNKGANVPGLQIADILAYPSYKCMLLKKEGGRRSGTFSDQVARVLERSKYDRSPYGVIDGWGTKWLP
jgi:hypothetical protein